MNKEEIITVKVILESTGVECPNCHNIVEIEIKPDGDYNQGVEHHCYDCGEDFLVFKDKYGGYSS